VQYPSVFSRFVGTVPDRFGFAMLVARANAVAARDPGNGWGGIGLYQQWYRKSDSVLRQ
jgi:hypothetical protein